ncbi:MAG TPA: hypothetical protein VGE22_12805 [Solimonas sp.]
MDLTFDELVLLSNALNEILNGPGAIDDWEFQTRTGVEREAAIELQKRLSSEVRQRGIH